MTSERYTFRKFQEELGAVFPADSIDRSHEDVLDFDSEAYLRHAEAIGEHELLQEMEAEVASIKQDLDRTCKNALLSCKVFIGITNISTGAFGIAEVATLIQQDRPDRAVRAGLFGAGLIFSAAGNAYFRLFKKEISDD